MILSRGVVLGLQRRAVRAPLLGDLRVDQCDQPVAWRFGRYTGSIALALHA